MKNYSKHFLMNKEDILDYVVDVVHYFDSKEGLQAEELSDGNINYVHRIIDSKTSRSIILKQADTTPRTANRPLDLHRNKIETEILKMQNQYAPGFVPKIYHCDETMAVLCMEDVSEFKNMRLELANSKSFEHFADQISTFMAKTLLPTTDLVLSRKEKKERVQLFTNIDLCDVTEDLVFTEPYYDYKCRNAISEGNEAFVNQMLYRNEELKGEVGLLRNEFMNHAQAAIHGDLHSGSIFINDQGIKVIDPEFAFYGPMAYDVGNVIGNLFFSLVNKLYVDPENGDFIGWIRKTIIDVTDLTLQKIGKKFDEIVTFPLYNKCFKAQYLEDLRTSAIGYAGTEIIRRTVGEVKVLEIESVTDLESKKEMERLLIDVGTTLIMQRKAIMNGEQLMRVFDVSRKG